MDNSLLLQTGLFQGVREDELGMLLKCFGAREKRYDKDSLIWRTGDCITELGLVESGSVNIAVNFYWGGSHIFGHVGQGQIFGETYAAIPCRELMVDVVAAEDCEVLFFCMDKLMSSCSKGCPFHNRIIQNLIRITAEKNLGLSNRMMHTASRSIRNRLTSYLSQQAQEKGSNRFSIPFSRQQLADYLGVDRSALSAELSRMQRDGLIRYRKNEFALEKEFDAFGN